MIDYFYKSAKLWRVDFIKKEVNTEPVNSLQSHMIYMER